MDERTEARIAALEAELERLRELVGAPQPNEPATSDRRGMVKLMVASAVGAITGAGLLNAQPAAAIDGDPVLQGVSNDSTATTVINASAGSALSVFGQFVGIESDGTFANAYFPGSGGRPIGPGGVKGALYVDREGNWWASTIDIDPTLGQGRWRKMAGPGTAGQLHVLPTPVRVYDSRPGEAPAAVGPKVPLVGNSPRSIDTTANGSGVPVTATTVLVNLTITRPQTAGFAAAWPAGAWPGTSSINFAAAQDIAATTVVGCGIGASMLIQSNTVTDFLIDVIGYYE